MNPFAIVKNLLNRFQGIYRYGFTFPAQFSGEAMAMNLNPPAAEIPPQILNILAENKRRIDEAPSCAAVFPGSAVSGGALRKGNGRASIPFLIGNSTMAGRVKSLETGTKQEQH